MHKTQKVKFIRELIRNVQADIIKNVANMPDDWNGLELRLYIADKFAENVAGHLDARRVREYRNTVLVQNL